MKHLFILFTILLMALASQAAQTTPAVEVASPRVEYFCDPMGVDSTMPRLSWKLDSASRGVRQTAYQVLVASTPELLAAGKGDLWDSGKVTSGQSNQVAYAGKPLESDQDCFWKVKVWCSVDGSSEPISAQSAPSRWSTGLLKPSDWKAKWIGRDDGVSSGPGNGKEKYLPATYLRREFTLDKKPVRAMLYVTSLGVAEPRLNGAKVGDDFLSPGWTDFRKRLYYRAYDVTKQLHQGANVLGAISGDGWFRGRLSIVGQNVYGRQTRLFAQLNITYSDGSKEVIATDEGWKGGFGPILETDIYAGETYDATREITGWDAPGFNDADWKAVNIGATVNPSLGANPGAPIRRTGEIKTVAITNPKPGISVYDFGRNFSGWIRLRIQAPAGTAIVMRFGEMLNPDGTVHRTNLRAARATDTYICKGNGEEVWEPRFTYHGFQYVEVEGLPPTAGPETLTAIIVGSDLPSTGNFECSNDTMTRTAANQRTTMRANLVDLPTDCPQRDERMGWMDYHEVAASALYEQDAATLLTKWTSDMMDARREDGSFSSIAPDVHRFPWWPGWADSGMLIPWEMYRVYGDTGLVSRYYKEIAGHLDSYAQNSKDFIVNPEGLGDWLALGEGTPKDVIATALYARCAEVMAIMARALGKTEDAETYSKLHQSIAEAFRKKFVAADGKVGNGSQGSCAMAIAYDLLEPEQVPKAGDRLVAAIEKRNGHLAAGMVTAHLLLPALSKAGRTEEAYQLFSKTTMPSWGYFLSMGATSMWERWDSKTEKGINTQKMNSFNHANLGTCTEWFYRNVLGMDAAEPGFGKLIIKPEPGGDLAWAKGHYDSDHGRIVSNWKRENGRLTMEVTIPANTTAEVFVPTKDANSVTESGKPASQAEGVKFLRMQNDAAVYAIGSGTYRFETTIQ
jgi:alpha-L-rhamnosidase